MLKLRLDLLLVVLLSYSKQGQSQYVRRQTETDIDHNARDMESYGFSMQNQTNDNMNESNVRKLKDSNHKNDHFLESTGGLEPGDQGIRGGGGISALPWFAVFQSPTLCGGSLIHGDILLTAAHCVDDNGLPGSVRVGSNNYFHGGVVTNVVSGVLYPGWTWSNPSDPDLAVLKLKDFLPNQLAVVNGDADIPSTGHYGLFAMGFGLIDDKTSSQSLKGTTLPFLNDCSYQSSSYAHYRHICADSRKTATCGGDSGSPIMLGQYSNVQVGINSYSNGGCLTQTLDIYTRVSYFKKWIDEQVCQLSVRPPNRCFAVPNPTEPPITTRPTELPTELPTNEPTLLPTRIPTTVPTMKPSSSPTAPTATSSATGGPTRMVSTNAANEVSNTPTISPTDSPTKITSSPTITTSTPTAATLSPTISTSVPTTKIPTPAPTPWYMFSNPNKGENTLSSHKTLMQRDAVGNSSNQPIEKDVSTP